MIPTSLIQNRHVMNSRSAAELQGIHRTRANTKRENSEIIIKSIQVPDQVSLGLL
jgi:hypothetical protein